MLILRFSPLSLVPGGTLNVPSRLSTNPPPTETSGCSTSQPTRASGRTCQTRGQTWSNSCWPGSPTTTKQLCRFISPPTTLEPTPTSTAGPGCPGWTKRRTRRGNIRECTRKVGTAGRRRRRKSAACASCRRSSWNWTPGWCPIGSEVTLRKHVRKMLCVVFIVTSSLPGSSEAKWGTGEMTPPHSNEAKLFEILYTTRIFTGSNQEADLVESSPYFLSSPACFFQTVTSDSCVSTAGKELRCRGRYEERWRQRWL